MNEMRGYTVDDFLGYFAGAEFLHPVDGVPCSITGVTNDGVCVFRVRGGGEVSPIKRRDVTFEMFGNYPELGYRHTQNGRFLFNIKHVPRRQARKGLRFSSLVVEEVPEVELLAARAGQAHTYLAEGDREDAIMDCVLRPSFLSLRQAVAILMSENSNALGVAISPSTAVTFTSAGEVCELVLLFRGASIASSKDGTIWETTAEEYDGVLSRILEQEELRHE